MHTVITGYTENHQMPHVLHGIKGRKKLVIISWLVVKYWHYAFFSKRIYKNYTATEMLMKVLYNHKNLYLGTIGFVSVTSKQTDCRLSTKEFT